MYRKKRLCLQGVASRDDETTKRHYETTNATTKRRKGMTKRRNDKRHELAIRRIDLGVSVCRDDETP